MLVGEPGKERAIESPRFTYVMENNWTENALAKLEQYRKVNRCPEMCCPCQKLCESCQDDSDAMTKEGRGRLCTFDCVNERLECESFELPVGGSKECFFMHACSPRYCRCPKNCPLSFIERGRQVPLVVFFEPQIESYGVRAITDIPCGTYISDYLGKVVVYAQAGRSDPSYQFTCSTHQLVINAKEFGNESRFFAHSCQPNMTAVRVFCEGWGQLYHKICLFTIREVRAGEALTFDYHPENEKPAIYLPCKCGSTNCRGWV